MLEKTPYDVLLAQDENDSLPVPQRHRLRASWTQQHIRLPIVLVISISQFLLWSLTIIYFASRSDAHHCGSSTTTWFTGGENAVTGYYPAAEAVEYEEKTFAQENIFKTRHGSVPSDATDAAWEELLAPSDGVIQASYETGFDLGRMVETVKSKVDVSQNAYGLEVYHQLHCLNRVRKSFYADHYFPDEEEKQRIFHREHCIEHLRQSIMCSGDVSLDYWHVDEEDGKSYLKTDVPHVCRRFDKLSEWVRQNQMRAVSWNASAATASQMAKAET